MSGGLVLSWQLITVIFAGLSLWSGLFLLAMKFLLDRSQGYIEQRFQSLEDKLKKLHQEQEAVEAKHHECQRLLPHNYVTREDKVRNDVTVDAKMDAIWRSVEELRERIFKLLHALGDGRVIGGVNAGD